MLTLPAFIDQQLLQKLITFFSITLISYSLLLLTQKIVIAKFKAIAKKTESTVDDLLAKLASSLNGLFYLSISILIALQFISLPEKWSHFITRVLVIVFAYFVAKSVAIVVGYFFDQFIHKQLDKDGSLDISILRVLKKTSRGIVWIIAAIWLLNNFGYDVTTIIGGLGIAGVAVAFGIQNILEDIFSYFSIYLDRPFETGDFIIIGEDKGKVEKIGIRSTRLRTLRGEVLIVSNKDLTQSRINNFKKLRKRQDRFDLRIDLATPADKLEKLPDILEEIVTSVDQTEFSRANFKEITENHYLFQTIYYVKSSDFSVFSNIKQKINLEIVRRLEKEDISLATTYQIVEVKKVKDNHK